jgi:hypothetical protein
VCDFSPEASPVAVLDRDLKTKYLKDMITYVTSGRGVFPENTWGPLMKMVTMNIFRVYPNQESPIGYGFLL